MGVYEEIVTSSDTVGRWVKKGQNHDDVILEWSLGVIWPKSKRPKSQILCHKNISPRDLYNMTLLLAHILLPNIRVTKVDSKVCATEGASAQLQIWIFKFWPYGQLRAVLKKVLGPIMSK